MDTAKPHPTPPRSPIKEAILRRVKVLYLLFFLLGVAILSRIVWLQVGSESKLMRHRADQYSFRREVLEAARGNIYSDDGRLLATSIPYYELRMDTEAGSLTDELFNSNVDSLSVCLARFFGDKSAADYRAELRQVRAERKRYHLITHRKVNYLELQTIRDFPLFRLGANKGGFLAVESSLRVRPHGELAARTIGFVNQSGIRLGIEGGFEEYLRGTSGLVVKQKISGTFWTPIADPSNIDPIDGIDVVSTLDIEMQDLVQKSLREWIAEVEADWGTVIVMEVATGQVKALSNITRKADGTLAEDYNYAIGMSMEPGSTFKLPVLLALLDDAKMLPTTPINTGSGTEQIGLVKVVDSHGGYGTIPLQTVFEKSSNVGMARAVESAYAGRPAQFVNAINRLNINKPLDLQLAGEARPLIKHPGMNNGWDGMTMTMMSYGYALRQAPIHTLTLYNAVANNGVMVKPMFVSELRRQSQLVKHFPIDTINPSIASPQTIAAARRALEGVVINGTARMLKNPLYSVAAKTGTAQVAMGRGGYTTATGGRHYLGTLVGYLPADRPRYTILVALKTYHAPGSAKPYYGAQLSGPLFKTIADKVYGLTDHLSRAITSGTSPYDPALDALPGSAADLSQLLSRLRISGAPMLPVGDSLVALRRGVVVTPAPMPLTGGVPDLQGLTLAEALTLAEGVGLRPRFVGLGTVVSQSLPAGNPFEQGLEIRLTLGRGTLPPKAPAPTEPQQPE